MPEIRLDETFDGICTVVVGSLVITDLTREEADRIVALYPRANA